MLLTGDNAAAAHAVATDVGIAADDVAALPWPHLASSTRSSPARRWRSARSLSCRTACACASSTQLVAERTQVFGPAAVWLGPPVDPRIMVAVKISVGGATDHGGHVSLHWKAARSCQPILLKEVHVNRGAAALLLGAAMVPTACGTVTQPPPAAETGIVGRAGSDTAPAAKSACTDTPTDGVSTVMVDWIDFLQLNGTQYVADRPGSPQSVSSQELGGVIGRVTCMLSALKFTQQPGPAVDGDAAFLPIGTEVFSIKGVASSCRVAVKHQGVNRAYVAVTGPTGSTSPTACDQR